MKKYIAYLLLILLLVALIGCGKPEIDGSINDIAAEQPSITGYVKEIAAQTILIESDGSPYWVSTKDLHKDSDTSFQIGEEVIVYYDGNVAESYPMQIHTVYAIIKKTSAAPGANGRP